MKTLAELLEDIKEAREALASWAICLEWDIRFKRDLTDCIDGIDFWATREQIRLDRINAGRYIEVNPYGTV